jgi:hypothetical protein
MYMRIWSLSILCAVALGAAVALSCAFAASTIDPTQPRTGGAFTSAPVRNNFVAAFNDINQLQNRSSSNAQPINLQPFQDWANTTGCPNNCALTIFDGNSPVQWGTLNKLTHQFYVNPFFLSGIVTPAPTTFAVLGGGREPKCRFNYLKPIRIALCLDVAIRLGKPREMALYETDRSAVRHFSIVECRAAGVGNRWYCDLSRNRWKVGLVSE